MKLEMPIHCEDYYLKVTIVRSEYESKWKRLKILGTVKSRVETTSRKKN